MLAYQRKTVGFEILPPVWRRWWFLTAIVSIVLAGIVAFARSRYERVKALRESENRFRTLAETASDAIVTVDEDGSIVLVNRAAETIFGYTRQELLGCDLAMLVPARLRERQQMAFGRYVQTGESPAVRRGSPCGQSRFGRDQMRERPSSPSASMRVA